MNQYEQGCRCEECYDERTTVVFRRWPLHPRWGILALFPDIDAGHGLCSSYQHVGQHSAAHYDNCIARTVPATPDKYADLKAELESLGYNLRVVKRRVRK